MKIEWTEPALLDFSEYSELHAAALPSTFATRFVERIIDAVEKLANFSKDGAKCS